MKLLKYIPLQLIIFQIIGIIIGFYCSFTIKTSTTALLITLFALVVAYLLSRKRLKQHSYFTISTFIAFIVIGIASTTFNKSIQNKNNYSSYLSETNNTSILIINEILKPNSYNNRYFANVTTVNSIKVHGKILINIQKDSGNNTINVDDKIFISHRFDSIKAPLNPYQFNYKEYLKNQQVYHQISIKNKEYLLLKSDHKSIKGWAFSIRKRINNALTKFNFKGDQLSIINALLLGQRQEISKNILQNYQNAGAVHILAVSGLHVGIILIMLTFLLSPLEKLKYGIFIKLLIIVFLLWVFAFIAGLSASTDSTVKWRVIRTE